MKRTIAVGIQDFRKRITFTWIKPVLSKSGGKMEI